jgi:hypothetical protein
MCGYFYSPFSGRQDGSSPHPEAEAHGHLPHLQVQRQEEGWQVGFTPPNILITARCILSLYVRSIKSAFLGFVIFFLVSGLTNFSLQVSKAKALNQAIWFHIYEDFPSYLYAGGPDPRHCPESITYICNWSSEKGKLNGLFEEKVPCPAL